MVSLAFHLFVVDTVIFAVCSQLWLSVDVHSFIADSSLLDCVCSSTLCLQVGSCLGFWGGFSCFVSFIWCQLFACLIRAAIFRLPPAFVVWSFFLCHRHLWSVLSFFATGICVQPLSFTAFSAIGIVRLFVFALLALVSGYQCMSQFLLSCCALAACQEIRTGLFSKSVTLWTALQILPWSKPHLVFHHKVYAIALSKVLATQMGVTGAQHQLKSARLNCTNLTHFRLTAGRFRSNSRIVMLWVACELLQFAATQ